MKSYTICKGDARTVLDQLEPDSIDCCVTSPPYWGLRDYDIEGQIGLERTPEEYIAILVDVFRAVRRVLRPDGTLWINLGDSYASRAGSRGEQGKHGEMAGRSIVLPRVRVARGKRIPRGEGRWGGGNAPAAGQVKPKDMVGIPWRVALALQADGWWLRQDIIWSKPNPLPESVRDRCTKAHEYIFLLSKSERYYYDAEAIKEAVSGTAHSRGSGVNPKAKIPSGWDTRQGSSHHDLTGRYPRPRQNESFSGAISQLVERRNKRSVWTIPTQPTAELHFATFPIEIPETCLLAGSRPGGIVLDTFSGSGTTGMAAMKNGRRYFGVEIKQEYIDITHERFQKYMPLLAGAV